jgi:hypothetical protein
MEGVDIPPNIAAAIRRSREARKALRARRRRTAIVIAALCVAAAAPISLSFADLGAGDMVQAAANRAQSLVDMLNARSPGQRTEAQLTKTQRKQMALAKMHPPVRNHPVAPPSAHELANILLGPPPAAPVQVAAMPPIAPPTLGAIMGPPPGNSLIVTPGGGGGGTPGGSTPASNPTPQPREPVIVPPAVPEPATWLMMLLGFGLIGWRLRRTKATDQQLLIA